MPRDGSGNYTLPAGNPVVSGEVITPTWANPTMDDIALELTDSLSRTGKGSMLVPFSFGDGTISAPGIGFGNEPTSGLYRAGTNDVRMTVGATDKTRWIAGDFGFEIWSGSAWVKPVVPNADITVTGTWTFDNIITGVTTGNLTEDFDGNISGAWNFTGVTPQIAGINIATLNDVLAPPNLDAYTQFNVAETITNTWTFDLEIQGVTSGNLIAADIAGLAETGAAENITGAWNFVTGTIIQNGDGDPIKIGYRNPDTFSVAGGSISLQSLEGRVGQYTSPGNSNLTINSLEQYTNISLEQSSSGIGILNLIEGSATITWLDGEGDPPKTGDRSVAPNSIVHLRWRTATDVALWGNGIT